jgi:hypothetical protein
MKQARWFRVSGLAAISLMLSLALAAQAGDPADLLLKKLNEQFVPTVFDQNETEIVTPGTVVALKTDGHISDYIQDPDRPSNGMVVFRLPLKYCPITTYKKGTLSMGFGDSSDVAGGDSLDIKEFFSFPRKYLHIGDKFWIDGIGIEKNSIRVYIITDPYDDGRYCGVLKFPFEKNHLPTLDDAVKMISEVLSVQPAQDQSAPAAPAPAPVPAPVTPAAPTILPEIAPPPPPPDAPPPTIALGQTMDQVTTGFGQPLKVAKLGAKTIFYYKDMKVTFTNGKVSNVE